MALFFQIFWVALHWHGHKDVKWVHEGVLRSPGIPLTLYQGSKITREILPSSGVPLIPQQGGKSPYFEHNAIRENSRMLKYLMRVDMVIQTGRLP